jgi:methionyl aminopeptidase
MIETKSRAELETMDRVNRVVRTILAELVERAQPGVSTGELNRHAEKRLAELGAKPAFKGYPHPGGGPAYPAVLCTSINEEVVHGIPALTARCGRGHPEPRLRRGDRRALRGRGGHGRNRQDRRDGLEADRRHARFPDEGIEKVCPGNRISDISAAVQSHAESHGFSVVREFVGTASAGACTRIRPCRTSSIAARTRGSRRGWSWRSSR